MGLWRCPEAGIAHLKWASTLKKDESWVDKDSPDFGHPTVQAWTAMEILTLYNWWKWERPKRVDPSDVSGWSDYCDEVCKVSDNNFLNNKNYEQSRAILNRYGEIESKNDEEDTEMLLRLINIRQNLWT